MKFIWALLGGISSIIAGIFTVTQAFGDKRAEDGDSCDEEEEIPFKQDAPGDEAVSDTPADED